MKRNPYIIILFCAAVLLSCSGSRKYFKVAERLEKQGLVNEAAEYYLEALQRKPTSAQARIKLKEVGQKHVSNMASEFFRNFNTQQLDASLESYEKMKDFYTKANAINVTLDYPRAYDEDYQKAVEMYCSKNYSMGYLLVNQKKYSEALTYIRKVEKYNSNYKSTKQLSTIAFCEPLYQSAINNLQSKNYSAALNLLAEVKGKSEDYKDSRDLLELSTSQQQRSFILFEPKPSGDQALQQIQEFLYTNFSQAAQQKFNNVQIINNSPFQNAPSSTDLNNSNNLDLVQAIRKATGADYFYVFDVSNKREYNSGNSKTGARGFEEVVTRINDTTTKTEYKPFDYYVVKSSRSYSYDFKYKIINAYSNQFVASQLQNMKAADAVEYNEFARRFTGNINSLYPYNPPTLSPIARYNPKNWRNQFSARSDLKSFEDLKTDVLNQNIKIFVSSAYNMK
ncbi:MAG: hypothetical protein PSX36_02965 [bacterium]|nr:hypothetical protein [bacterium]